MQAGASRADVVAEERRWALPVALLTLAGIGLLVGAAVLVSSVTGDGDAEVLRSAHENSSDVVLSSALQALAFAMLTAPLVYLFRAAQARSDRVRGQLIGLVVAAPLFLAAASVLNAAATDDAASEFVAGKATSELSTKEATEECRTERSDDADAFAEEYGGGKGRGPLHSCTTTAIADDAAANAIADAPLRDAATGFGLGGRLGLAFALFYSCLWAMRTGLLSRFWGSLGMALGAAALLLLIQFTLIWFLYFALLVAGWIPGGKPPAWDSGEAIPWPTPGEKAASELDPSAGSPEDRT